MLEIRYLRKLSKVGDFVELPIDNISYEFLAKTLAYKPLFLLKNRIFATTFNRTILELKLEMVLLVVSLLVGF